MFYLAYFFPSHKLLDLVSSVFLARALTFHGGGGGLLLLESRVGHLHREWGSCAESTVLLCPPLPGVRLQHDDTTTLCNVQEKAHSWSSAKYFYSLSTQNIIVHLSTESIKATLKLVALASGQVTEHISSAYVY